jgi:hypothetical protein
MADNANSFGSTKKGMTHLDSPYVIHSLAAPEPYGDEYTGNQLHGNPYEVCATLSRNRGDPENVMPLCNAQSFGHISNIAQGIQSRWLTHLKLVTLNTRLASKESTFQQVKTYLRLCM